MRQVKQIEMKLEFRLEMRKSDQDIEWVTGHICFLRRHKEKKAVCNALCACPISSLSKGMSRDPPQRTTGDTFLSPLMPNSCPCLGNSLILIDGQFCLLFCRTEAYMILPCHFWQQVLHPSFSFLFLPSCRLFLEDYATVTYRHEVMEKLPCVDSVSCRPRCRFTLFFLFL